MYRVDQVAHRREVLSVDIVINDAAPKVAVWRSEDRLEIRPAE